MGKYLSLHIAKRTAIVTNQTKTKQKPSDFGSIALECFLVKIYSLTVQFKIFGLGINN